MSNRLEKYIRDNVEQLDRKQPNLAVLDRVLQEMKSKEQGKRGGSVISLRWAKWAAACLLVAAGGIAVWYFNKPQPATGFATTNIPEKRPAPMPKTEPVEPDVVEIKQDPVATFPKVVVHKVQPKKTIVFAGINDMQSAASRINAVTSASRMKNNGKEVVDALVKVLNNDPNTNVRLAALDGLTRFHKQANVRQKLVASLKKQQDPLVQIDMIGLLTGMRELGILSELEEMVNDENVHRAVKDIAWTSIHQLRTR
ncbi:MAG: HEAT repeat domain-containing protein [Niastella sp.]|nr:HEAT repeat domain-containing protein [Niastella sp.]